MPRKPESTNRRGIRGAPGRRIEPIPFRCTECRSCRGVAPKMQRWLPGKRIDVPRQKTSGRNDDEQKGGYDERERRDGRLMTKIWPSCRSVQCDLKQPKRVAPIVQDWFTDSVTSILEATKQRVLVIAISDADRFNCAVNINRSGYQVIIK